MDMQTLYTYCCFYIVALLLGLGRYIYMLIYGYDNGCCSVVTVGAVGRQMGKEETDASFTRCPAPGPGGVKGTGTWRWQNLYQFLPRHIEGGNQQ